MTTTEANTKDRSAIGRTGDVMITGDGVITVVKVAVTAGAAAMREDSAGALADQFT